MGGYQWVLRGAPDVWVGGGFLWLGGGAGAGVWSVAFRCDMGDLELWVVTFYLNSHYLERHVLFTVYY